MDPFSYSSSSSSPSTSPSHHHQHHRTLTFIPPPPAGTPRNGGSRGSTLVGSWMGARFDPDDDHLNSRPTEEEEPKEAGMAAATSGGGPVAEIEKEHMFDKVVTPSDVGKLNRLVIPKQHAEKYFPLDSSANEKGLLLNFEDRNGKAWRFRYSYWNSSQSYVMTKGWSRFVKEKKLDAGDMVSFQRGVGEAGKGRLFIDWRRRPSYHPFAPPHHGQFSYDGSVYWGVSTNSAQPHPFLLHHGMDRIRNSYLGQPGVNYGYGSVVNVSPCGEGSLYYLNRWGMAPPQPPQAPLGEGIHVPGGGPEPATPVVFDSVPVVHGNAAAKRVRLFGVNLDCSSSEPGNGSQDCDMLSSSSISHTITMGSQPSPHQYPAPPPPSHHQFKIISTSSSPSPSQNPHLQSMLYNGTPLMTKVHSIST
ncbi:hypothetical protein SAY87_015305 [Trapa incisa]|uniref:TF-B3 domain-containing protein n=1 Tax=Trapa incisa TaxID=236973 RepID=A0AAN7JKW8_9MYRT|nr:hypothetical protein SAY87_015305 [Trapa incisa]